MWIASIESRRRWLRPGAVYTVGRSSSDEASRIVVKEPSVSRDHLTIAVGGVQTSLSPSITVTDLGSRFGSKLDGEPLPPLTAKALAADCELASLEVGTRAKIVLRWVPATITFSGAKSEQGQLEKIRSLVEPLGIRVSDDIVPSTSYFIKASKTSSKLVYALSRGIPIVSVDFAQAIADTAADFEKDYDAFPDPLNFLVDPRFAPNPNRKLCLADQAFYFYDADQFAALEPVIKRTGGRAVLAANGPYESGMLVVDPPDDSSKAKAEKLGSIVEPSAFLVSIRDCEPLKVNAAPRPRRKQIDMLTFMTQSQTSPKRKRIEPIATSLFDQTASQSPEPQALASQPKRKRIEPIASSLFSQTASPEPPASTSQPGLSNRKRVEPVASSFFEPPTAPEPLERGPSPEVPVPPRTAQKRTRATPSATKRTARAIDVDVQDYDDSDESLSMPSTPELANLVLVENSIKVHEIPELPDITPSQAWSKVPNFKAFKRKHKPESAAISLVEAEKCETENLSDEALFVDDSQEAGSPYEEDEFSFHFS